MVHAVAALFLAASASAAPSQSFEQVLGNVRASVLQTRAEQVKAKSQSDVVNADWETRNHARNAWTLRSRVQSVRSACQRARTTNPPRVDQFLRMEVQRLSWDVRTWSQDLTWTSRRVQTLAQQAQKDPDSVNAAQNLVYSAQNLRGETQWLSSDAGWLAWDLRTLGFGLEAWDIERLTREGNDLARGLERDASDLLGKVR